MPDAPVYGEGKTEDVVEFIDKFISCSCDVEEHEKLQEHKHSGTCRKKGKGPVCRFPLPPMPCTMILEPLAADNKDAEKNFHKIQETQNKMGDGAEENFEEFLRRLDLSEKDYVTAIRFSL